MLDGLDKIDLTADDAMDQINALAGGLVGKNAQLLEKLADSKGASSASAAELEALKLFKQNADVKMAEDAKSYTDAKALTQTAHEEALAKLQGDADNANAQLKTLLIDNGLSAALDGVNINKNLKAGAVAMLQSGATIVDGKAMIDDESLSDAVTKWAESDTGKAFCNAPQNQGGDGIGGNKTPAGKPLTLTEQAIEANKARNK